MDLGGLPVRSTADTYLQDLQQFLPKYVPRGPAMTKTVVCVIFYLLFFHFFLSEYIGLNVDFDDEDKKSIDRFLYFSIATLTSIGIATFLFSVLYYNDNVKKNGNWITMKKLGMTFFHPE